MNINSRKSLFCPYSILVNKCRGSCNDISNPYTRLCVPNFVNNLNIKVFNLMSKTNERRHIEWHETCTCKCRLNASVCNNKQRGKMINADVKVKN